MYVNIFASPTGWCRRNVGSTCKHETSNICVNFARLRQLMIHKKNHYYIYVHVFAILCPPQFAYLRTSGWVQLHPPRFPLIIVLSVITLGPEPMAATERVLLLAFVFRNIFAYGEDTKSNIVWILFLKLYSKN